MVEKKGRDPRVTRRLERHYGIRLISFPVKIRDSDKINRRELR